jgi:hypothetical protein
MAFIYHQVFCDESGKYHNPNDPLIAFSGLCITPDRLGPFDREWRALLRAYEIDSLHMERATRLIENCGYRLHSHQTVEERTELLLPFADCINKHFEVGFIQAWSLKGFNSIPNEARKHLGGSSDPYFLAFVRGLQEVSHSMGEDDRISLICDDDVDTALDCYTHYRKVGQADHTIAKKTVAISFANDKHFPALQAADMAAFLTKHEAGFRYEQIPNMWEVLYDRLVTEPEPPYGIMRWRGNFADEELLVKMANQMAELAEQKKHEKQQARNIGIRRVRQNDASVDERATQRDTGGTGEGKGSKDAKKAGD